jgi:NADH:ubiquinone oxidoreductase subunit K
MSDLPLYHQLLPYLMISLFLFACGLVGIMARRSLISVLVSVELLMNGAGLNFVAFSRFGVGDAVQGNVITLFVMGVAAVETAVALAIIILIFRRFHHLKPGRIHDLKG